MGAPAETRPFDARHAAVMARGRTLSSGSDARVVHDAPFLLATSCEARDFELAVRWITRFAFALIAVVGALVAIGAIPRLMSLIALGWLVPAIGLRWLVRRGRVTLGRALVDFEAGLLTHVSLDGGEATHRLDDVEVSTTVRGGEVWLLARVGARRRLRLARGAGADIDRLLVLFRQHHVKVRADH